MNSRVAHGITQKKENHPMQTPTVKMELPGLGSCKMPYMLKAVSTTMSLPTMRTSASLVYRKQFSALRFYGRVASNVLEETALSLVHEGHTCNMVDIRIDYCCSVAAGHWSNQAAEPSCFNSFIGCLGSLTRRTTILEMVSLKLV